MKPEQKIVAIDAASGMQQNFVLALASLALSTLVALDHLQVVWAVYRLVAG